MRPRLLAATPSSSLISLARQASCQTGVGWSFLSPSRFAKPSQSPASCRAFLIRGSLVKYESRTIYRQILTDGGPFREDDLHAPLWSLPSVAIRQHQVSVAIAFLFTGSTGVDPAESTPTIRPVSCLFCLVIRRGRLVLRKTDNDAQTRAEPIFAALARSHSGLDASVRHGPSTTFLSCTTLWGTK
jgi:hypothetical protein